jgi:hypothetical protein
VRWKVTAGREALAAAYDPSGSTEAGTLESGSETLTARGEFPSRGTGYRMIGTARGAARLRVRIARMTLTT